MDSSMFYMLIILGCIWLILDEIMGKKYISTFVASLVKGED